PTAALIWLWVNRELAFWGGFVSSSYLLVSVVIFALIAFAAPRLFPSLLGRIWHGMISVNRSFGWSPATLLSPLRVTGKHYRQPAVRPLVADHLADLLT